MNSTNEGIDLKLLYQETVIGLMVVNPFFYHWLQQLRFIPTTKVQTAAVAYDTLGECGKLFINEEFFSQLTLRQRMFILQHELLHWVYQHPLLREGGRPLFNIAADLYINTQTAKNPHLDMPTGEHEGITWENLPSSIPGLDMSNAPDNSVGTLAILEWLEMSARPKTLRVAIVTPGKATDNNDQDQDAEPPDMVIVLEPVNQSEESNDDDESKTSRRANGPQDLDPDGHDGDPEELLRGSQGADEPRLPEDADSEGTSSGGEDGSEADAARAQEVQEQLAKLAQELAKDHELWDDYGDPQQAEGALQRLAQDLAEAKERTDPEDFVKGCGDIAGTIASIIEAANKPKLNWRRELRHFVGYCGAVTLRGTYGQFNKYHQTPKIKLLPGTKLAVLFDTSASVSDAEASAFLAEMEALNRDGVEVIWVEFDYSVQNVRPFKREKHYDIHGRGGTSFEAAFQWVRDNWDKERLTGVITCTDGECAWPSKALIPDPKRVLWVITNDRYVAPNYCGRTSHIKVDKRKR